MTNEPSPRPWSLFVHDEQEGGDGEISIVAGGEWIATMNLRRSTAKDDASLICDSVNEIERLRVEDQKMRAALEEICNRVSVALNCPRQGRGTRVEIEGLVHDLLKIKECARAAIVEKTR